MHFRKAFPDLVRFNDERIIFAFIRMFKIFMQQRSIGHDIRVFTYTEGSNNNKEKRIENG